MPESVKTKIQRYYFNYLFTCYRRTGVKILYLAGDYKKARIALPLNRKTKGYFGTLFGGSIYGAVDPVLMVMLNLILGNSYVVWDKAANIRFLKPGKSTLFADFEITDDEISEIKRQVNAYGKTDADYTVTLVDANKVEHAVVQKTLHIRKRTRAS